MFTMCVYHMFISIREGWHMFAPNVYHLQNHKTHEDPYEAACPMSFTVDCFMAAKLVGRGGFIHRGTASYIHT